MEINKLLINKVKELKDRAIKFNSKTQFLYKKIYDCLIKKENPILSKTQIKSLSNVGEKTYKLLMKHINDELQKSISTMNELEKYILLLDDSVYNNIKERIEIKEELPDIQLSRLSVSGNLEEINTCGNSTNPDNGIVLITHHINELKEDEVLIQTPVKKKKKAVNKTYIPGHRTGGYAILKALWIEDGISKHKIIYIAKDYADVEFKLNAKHSAWSSINTLMEKGLVYKENSTKKYYLTFEGRKIADKLFIDTSIIKNNTTDFILLVDAREIKSRSHRSFFQNYFSGQSIVHDTRTLDVGDFVWIKNEMICNYIVERKCGSDFVSSIIDGRFKEQKNRLKNTNISNIFYIVENLKEKDFKNVNKDHGYFCLTSTKLENIVVLETESINDTAKALELIDSVVRLNEEQEYKMSYSSFIDKGTKTGNFNINSFLYLSLLAIRGLNNEKAKLISDYYKSMKSLFASYEDGCLFDVLHGFGVSKKKIEDIVHLLLT